MSQYTKEWIDERLAANPSLAAVNPGVIATSNIPGRIITEQLAVKRDRLNKTERRFLEYLKFTQGKGTIGIQTITLKLAHDCRYTPDFWTWYSPDRMQSEVLRFYEVKGAFIREDSIIKLKTAATQFPMFSFFLCQWKDQAWTIKEVRAL